MANIPGATNILPGVVVDIETIGTGTSVPGGFRIAAIIGEGARSETIVALANGGGNDGLNPQYTSTSGADGRHFALSNFPIISNRTKLFKNGVLLQGTEGLIVDNSDGYATFGDQYDYIIDPTTGHIELQVSHLVDQGGSFYTTGATNIGVGTIQNLTILDTNAPTETWTIKCTSVQRNNLNQPIPGTAVFIAIGSVSGNILNANGVATTWIANNTVATNSILSFSILETLSGMSTISAFRQGDFFTIDVSSGTLIRNDSLTATYIAVGDINSPTFLSSMTDVITNHGAVSLSNTLSLGCQLAFANQAPGIMCVQAAPPLPRRISYELETNFPATSVNVDDFIIPLPVTPDPNSNIDIFVTNPITGIETQLLANKFTFYTLGTGGNPSISSFVFDNANPPAGNSFSYSVIQQIATVNFEQDGYLNRDLTTQINATFSSANITFNMTDIGKQLNVIDATNLANIGTFDIVSVANGELGILATGTPPFPDFINDTSVSFELIDPLTGLVIPSSSGTDGTLIAIGLTATGTFHSTAVNFIPFNPAANGLKIRITASVDPSNIGLFDITSFNSGLNTLTIAKSFVSEHNLKFEVLDPTNVSQYLVLNHNIVPNTYNLRVTIIDVKDAPFFDAGWELALASLETQEIDILVPLPLQTISVIFQNSLSHCLEMSNLINRKERVLYIGAINGLTPDNLTGAKLAAVENIGVLEGIQGNTVAEILAGNTEDLANYSVPLAYGETFRAVYFFPDQIVVQVGTENQIIDGFYQAAAGAGYTSSVTNVASPLTNKVLSGYTILQNRQFNQLTYMSLAAAGLCVVEPVAGGGLILWGKTTTQSTAPEEQEISIVFIRDRIAKSMRGGFQQYIGLAQDGNTVANITAKAVSLLKGFISQGIISQYRSLTVIQDPVEPRQIDVTVQVQPIYPLDYVFVKVGIGVLI